MNTGRPLRILSVEDDPKDAELIQATLESEGLPCQITRVETEQQLLASLQQCPHDLILADYTLPSFDGISALRLVSSICPDVPFIFVSGTLGEEVAIEALKLGATDYILKTKLSRLAPAVLRALREAIEISEHKIADARLRLSEAYLAEAQRLSCTGSFGWHVATGEIIWSRESFRIFDVETSVKPTIDLVTQRTHPEDRVRVREVIDRVSREKTEFDFEHRLLLPDASVKYLRVVGRPSEGPRGHFEFVGAVTDISERKRAEEELRRSENYLAEAQKLSHTGSWAVHVPSMQNIYWSREMYRIFNLDPAPTPPPYREAARHLHPEDTTYHATVEQAIRDKSDFEADYRLIFSGGSTKYIHVIGHPVINASGEVVELVGTAMDVTEQQQARAALESAFAEIRILQDQLYKENIALREEIDRFSMFEEIVGESPALQAVLTHVVKVAPTESTVLITGETGTGKELIARAIHKRSHRSARAFISVNCAAIPASLISSELFGHEKGAFTGAAQRRLGRFELAEGGTLFLDEIGEIPLDTQIALLRVLQEREFERVGSSKPIHADVRVIAATNRNLQDSIDAGTFRSDLYYRLNVFPIEMPALRNRKEDIPLLVEYFIDRYTSKAGKRIPNISRTSLAALKSYSWPGNIRELQNVIERSVIVCDTDTFTVDTRWLSSGIEDTDRAGIPILRIPPSQERKAIEAALAAARGRISGPDGAAAKLGIPPTTLDSKIKSLGIDKHRFKSA